MEITKIEYHSGDGGRWMTCEIDGRPAWIPAEQRPTLVEQGRLFVSFEDGQSPGEKVLEDRNLMRQYLRFVAF